MESVISGIKNLLISVLVLGLFMPSSASAVFGLSRKERAAKAAEKQGAREAQRLHGTPKQHVISGPTNVKHQGETVQGGKQIVEKLEKQAPAHAAPALPKPPATSEKPPPKPVAKSAGLLAREAAADKSGKKSINIPRASTQRSAPRRQGH